MTTTPRCDVVPMRGAVAIAEPRPVTDRMAAFLSDELFPLMAGCWPASASQLDSNNRGAAMAFGQLLNGLTPAQIRSAVMLLADDVDRQFAPRPAEVRAMCLKVAEAARDEPAKDPAPEVSMSAVRMRAESRLFCLHGSVDADLLREEMDCIVAELTGQGVKITGEAF